MNDESEPMDIGEMHWRQISVYRQLPRPNWYPPHRQTMQPPRKGPAAPQGYSGGHFAQLRRPTNNYSHPPLQGHGSGPSGYGSGPSPPKGHSGALFVPSRRFGAPPFGHNSSTYRQRRSNATPHYGKHQGSSVNDNKPIGNAFKGGPYRRNATNVGNGGKGFDTKKYSLQNIELEGEEKGETEDDTVGGNTPMTPQESDTIYTNPQMDQYYEHYGSHYYDYTWHDSLLLEDTHWKDQCHQHCPESFPHDHHHF